MKRYLFTSERLSSSIQIEFHRLETSRKLKFIFLSQRLAHSIAEIIGKFFSLGSDQRRSSMRERVKSVLSMIRAHARVSHSPKWKVVVDDVLHKVVHADPSRERRNRIPEETESPIDVWKLLIPGDICEQIEGLSRVGC